MKIAHLVQTHKNPELLRRRIGFLSSDESAFFIHVDAKSDINDFSSIRGGNVFFSERRVPVYWAEYSMVEAILILIRQAMDAPRKYDYFILSTGSDYPLRSRQYIHDFFERNNGREFISAIRMINEDGCVAIHQINTLRIPSDKPFYHAVMRVVNQTGLTRRDYRRHLGDMAPYFGNAGWALTRSACQYILEFVKGNPSYCKYFENSFAPDEMFFHTILGNSRFARQMRRHLTFEDWSNQEELKKGSGIRHWLSMRLSDKLGHPSLMTERHVSFFESSGKVMSDVSVYGPGEMLFARKFSDGNLQLVQRIEDMIGQWQRRARPVSIREAAEWAGR